jgi:hypothetical protein
MEIENGNENNLSQSIREITTDETNGKQTSQSEEGNLTTDLTTTIPKITTKTDVPTKLSRRSRRLKRLVKPCSVKIFKMNFYLN